MEETIYIVCAIAGCVIVGLQVGLQVLGFGAETDMDVDGDADFEADGGMEGDANAFFGFLSFKALCAFAGIFGLTGLIMLQRDTAFSTRIGVATGAGFAGMLFVGWMMRGLSRLQASGTLDPRNAVGRTATVYLRIPAAGAGRGKVTVEVQGRSLQLPATTDGDEIPTGRRVTVVALDGDETLKVTPL